MKQFFIALLCTLSFTALFAQQKETQKAPDPNKKVQEVEASCGQCKFGLKAKGCTLAVRVDGKAYFVEGTSIDQHGDAHAEDGFCNKIRKAKVQGEVVKETFVATYFQLVAEEERKKGE